MRLRKCIYGSTALLCVISASHLLAESRLLGLTGNQEHADQASFPDATLFEIDKSDASKSRLMPLTYIPDSHQIGHNPVDGLLYHTGGSAAWTDDPLRATGFRDHQYFERIDLNSGELTPIYNANPPESPDELPSFGPPAPRPTFVRPEKIRLANDPECQDERQPGICPRETGEDEYTGIRALTWSHQEGLFFGSDNSGVFTLSPDGDAKFIGRPEFENAEHLKGMSFYAHEDETLLLAGVKRDGRLFQIDPDTGKHVGPPVQLSVPAESPFQTSFDGLLAMAQDPDTGILYGIRRTDSEALDSFHRELITIHPESGATSLIGNLELHFASLTFVSSPPSRGDFNGNGRIDIDDANTLVWKVAGGMNELEFDLTDDGLVNEQDITEWIKAEDIAFSYFGDANLDREFNTSDLVAIFQSGKYNTQSEADWSTGDWNGDHRFDNVDLVSAFEDGGYEKGRRKIAIAPEPASVTLILIGLIIYTVHGGNRRPAKLAA